MSRRVLVPIVAAAIVTRLVVAIHLGTVFPSFGTREFYWIAVRRGRPYRDFEVEYPILMLGVIKSIGAVSASSMAFSRWVIWLNAVLDLGTAIVLHRTWGRNVAVFYLLATLPLIALVYGTLDAASVFGAVIAVAFWVKRRPVASGVALALSVFTKLWPGPLILLGWQARRATTARRYVTATMAVGAVALAAWLAIGGVDAVRQVVTYRGAEGWEIETIPGLVLVASHGADAVYGESGAARIGHVPTAARVILFVVSAIVASWAMLRGTSVGLIGVGWLTATVGLLLFATLLSPQFVFWLVPAAAIAWSERYRGLALSVAGSAALTGLEMAHWEWVIQARGTWLLLLALRNGVLVAVLCGGLSALARASSTGAPELAVPALLGPSPR